MIDKDIVFWRWLTHFWGLLAAIVFTLTFFNKINADFILNTIAIIYIAVLSIYTSSKEIKRWSKKNFFSKHKGEVFIIIYTALLIGFIFLCLIEPNKYNLPKEFTTTYLAILGIFAISLNSKYLKRK